MSSIEYIITVEEFRDYTDVSTKLRDKKVEECIKNAQYIDLQELTGDFVFFLIENKDNEDYEDLYNGGFYGDNPKKYHQGIKKLLSNMAYGRYMMYTQVTNTAFGAMQKNYQGSDPINYQTIKDIVRQTKIDNDKIWIRVLDYIMSDKDLKKYFNSCNNRGVNPTYSQKIYTLKK